MDYTAPMNYTDAILYGNLMQNINRDMTQTYKNVAVGATEQNPILAGNAQNKDFLQAMGLLGGGLLGNRWASMDNENQRRIEMVVANIIQANAMAQSDPYHEWQLQYGVNF